LGRNRRNKRDRRKFIKNCSKHIKVILPSIIMIICILVLSIKIYQTNEEKNHQESFNNEIFNANIELTEEEKQNIEEEFKRDISLSITVVGDLLCENNILKSVQNNNYNFSEIFSNIKKYTNNADITLLPLETNFANEEYSGKSIYNSPSNLAQEIKNIGTDIVFLANNHSMDYGINGAKETVKYLREIGHETVGIKLEENESNILIKEYRNIKLAFLSYTYGVNKKEEGYKKIINISNQETIKNDIEDAKKQGAEYIIASMHWGNAVGSSLNKEQMELSEFLINSGVDIILGNHPSSIQKMETRTNKDGKDVLIAYSLGNFLSSEVHENSNLGMILNIELVKLVEDNKVYLNKVTYVPTYIQDNGTSSENRYKILDIKEEISNYEDDLKNVDEKTYKKLKNALVKIKELING